MSQFEQDGMRYNFEPPVEIGSRKIRHIHELAAVALLGTDANSSELQNAIDSFTSLLQASGDRVAAFNEFLKDKHKVTGRSIGPGMPVWRSAPSAGPAPGAKLSPAAQAELREELWEIHKAEMAVRGGDTIA